MSNRFVCGEGMLFMVLGSCFMLPAFAQQQAVQALPGAISQPVASANADHGSLHPEQRGEMARQFVVKWGNYVSRVYDVPTHTWAMRMVPNFISADPTNLRNSLKRDTFEGAVSELMGSGQQVADSTVIDRMARTSLDKSSPDAMVAAAGKVLGALGNDLVYTPVQPCRIVDTRSTAGGTIAANSA